jgi:hypothetical protein
VSEPDPKKAGRCQWHECAKVAAVVVSGTQLCSVHGLLKHREELAKRRR